MSMNLFLVTATPFTITLTAVVLWYRRALRTGRTLTFLECETKNKNNVLLLLVKGSITKVKLRHIVSALCGCEVFSLSLFAI